MFEVGRTWAGPGSPAGGGVLRPGTRPERAGLHATARGVDLDQPAPESLSQAEALAALAALLEPLARWLAVTHGPQHRLEVAIIYLRSVPADRDLVQVLCSEALTAAVECLAELDAEVWEDDCVPCPA